MPDLFDDELRQIKLEQSRLEAQLRLLDERVHRLEASSSSSVASSPFAGPSDESLPVSPAGFSTPPSLPVDADKSVDQITPPALPNWVGRADPWPTMERSLQKIEKERVQGEFGKVQAGEDADDRPSEKKSRKQKESLEMQVGTFWLVRIGVVLLLTGLAFLAAYLYNNVFASFGPLGKVALLYLGSGILGGIGYWLERGREEMRNFGRVLLGGGLAAVYYTTYAAYHVEWLRVLPDPVAATSLLIAWSGFMVWLCQRRRSETMAIFSILLAYYASAIGSIFWYSLVANLVLALAAMFLLVRHRWIVLSFTSLIATYGSYLYWRFYAGSAPVAHDLQNLVVQGSFLAVYWLLFTAFALFAGWKEHRQRYSFASLNNALYFGAVGLSIRTIAPGEFWKFVLIYAVAVGCAALIISRRMRAKPAEEQGSDRSLRGMYAGQSICLFTLAVVTYFSGAQLAIILGAEMALLVSLGKGRTLVGRFLTVLLGLCASIAAVAEQVASWAAPAVDSILEIFGMFFGPGKSSGPAAGAHTLLAGLPGDFLTGLLVGSLALYSSWFSGKRDDRSETKAESGIYSFLGTVVLFGTICIQLDGPVRLIALALMPLAYVLAGGKIAFHLRWQAWVLALVAWENLIFFIYQNGWTAGATAVPTLLSAGIPVSLILVDCSIRRSSRKSGWASIYYAALGDSALYCTVYSVIEPTWLPIVLGSVAIAFSLLAIRLRFDAFRWGGPAFLVGAIATWAMGNFDNRLYPFRVPISLLVAVGVVEIAGRKNLPDEWVQAEAPHYFGALMLTGMAAIWSLNALSPGQMVWVFPLISVAFIGYGSVLKSSQTPLAGQFFLMAAIGLELSADSWVTSLAPLAGTLFARWYISRYQSHTRWFSIRKGYGIISLVLFADWVFRYLPEPDFSPVFALSGFALLGAALLLRKREIVYHGLILSLLALVCFFVPRFQVEPLNLVLPICLVLEQLVFTRFAAGSFGDPLHRISSVLALGAVIAAFIHLSNSLWQGSFGFYLTLGWTLLAFGSMIIGWVARERIYRLSGLVILGLALLKIAVLDVWRLELLARIISLLVLGVVLVLVGFVYTRFQNKIRQWL